MAGRPPRARARDVGPAARGAYAQSMIEVADLPGNLIGRFEGREHGSSVSFNIGTYAAGTGPSLHRHP